ARWRVPRSYPRRRRGCSPAGSPLTFRASFSPAKRSDFRPSTRHCSGTCSRPRWLPRCIAPMSGEPPRFDPAALVELPAELALGQLPPGRHGLPRSFVVRNQRLRLIAAMLRSLPEHGYAGTTISHLTQEAGLSRAAFYGQFSSKEDCFLATYDLAGEWLAG